MITIKQHDTRHALQATLYDVNNLPIDLTAAVVEFSMRRTYGGIQVKKVAHQTEQMGGVWVVFEEGDTMASGNYIAEFSVTYPDNRIETFPHNGYIQIKIEESVTR